MEDFELNRLQKALRFDKIFALSIEEVQYVQSLQRMR